MKIEKLVTADQIRAARALLRWTAKELAEKANVGVNTINRLESQDGDVNNLQVGTYNRIMDALNKAGISFDERMETDHRRSVTTHYITVRRVLVSDSDNFDDEHSLLSSRRSDGPERPKVCP